MSRENIQPTPEVSPGPLSRKSQSFRLALYYWALFLIVGIFVPFLPVWMGGRGLTHQEIGLILAAALWAKIPVGLGLAGIADQTGHRRAVLVWIGIGVLAGLALMIFLQGFWAILIGWVIVGSLVTTAMPVADSLSLLSANRVGINYGTVRRWGSISFIVASIVGGWYLNGRDSENVLILMIAGTVFLLVSTWSLPDLRVVARKQRRPAFLDALRAKDFALFAVTAALLQSSHAALYGFASLHWQNAGHSKSTIGWLWAEGVMAEIALFTVSGFLITRLGARKMLLLAAVAGLIRWTAMGMTTDLYWLIGLQLLHAFTFSVTHVAAFAFILRNVPEDLSASAQGVYDSLAMGLVFGLSMAAAGQVFAAAGPDAFLLMTAFSTAGGIGALMLVLRKPK